MAEYNTDFPYAEIRKRNGDYFDTSLEAEQAGYAETQIWSVTKSDGPYTYGPSFHYINVLGFIATKEHHDNDTYYHEPTEEG